MVRISFIPMFSLLTIPLALSCSDGTDGEASGGDDATDTAGEDTGDGDGESGSDGTGTGDATGTDGGGEPGGTEIWSLQVDEFSIKPQETDYVCFEFTTTFDKLAHIIGFVPKIDNAQYVHHYVLEMMDAPSGKPQGYSCYSAEGQMLWGWAPGIEPTWLPEEAGFLVGDDQESNGEVTLRLQIHYNNPLKAEGETDSSGLEVHYTHELRKHDAGLLTFGAIPEISIPPGEEAYEFVGTCDTSSYLSEPVTIFGATLHAHQIGSVLWTDVYRDGEKIYELNRDDPFDFSRQNYKAVDYELRPGDVVENHCIYDSTEREETTAGGPGSADEMCWDTITYYPKSDLGLDYCPTN